MATKTKKNISTKASKKASPKRTTKTAKAKAPKAIIVEESKGVYTMTTETPANTNNEVFEKLPETPALSNIESKPDNSDIIQENVSYNNFMLPSKKEKDYTISFIIGGLVLVIILWGMLA